MNYSLHIPRPSLSGSSTSRSGSSVHSFSADSNTYLPVGIHNSSSKNLLLNNRDVGGNGFNNNPRKLSSNTISDRRNSISSDFDGKKHSDKRHHQQKHHEKLNKSMDDRYNIGEINYGFDMAGQLKRGSRSSQGSNDSTGTNSSGSLLLTTANLERFVAIHNINNNSSKNLKNLNISPIKEPTTSSSSVTKNENRIKNVYTIANNHLNQMNRNGDGMILTDGNIKDTINNGTTNHPHHNDDTILEIDPNLHFVKTKDVDSVSIASSTHFTMINGVGGPQCRTKSNGICRRGHQITVLILTMSTFFLIGILLMVYLMEMRAREMPQM